MVDIGICTVTVRLWKTYLRHLEQMASISGYCHVCRTFYARLGYTISGRNNMPANQITTNRSQLHRNLQ